MTNENMRPQADNINPVVERHADGTALVRVDGAELRFAGMVDTPRVRDLDLAGWFGYERPRDIRKLLKRMEAEGKLRGVEWRATVARYSAGRSGKGIREVAVTEAWLTREQSLLVATQAEGDRAWALTEAMVKVFDAVLDRRPAAPQGITAEQVAEMIADALAARPQIAESERIERMILDRDADAMVLAPIRRMAASLAAPRATRADRARHVGRLHCRIRRALGWDGMWRLFPRHRLGELLVAVRAEEVAVERIAVELTRSRQLSLKVA